MACFVYLLQSKIAVPFGTSRTGAWNKRVSWRNLMEDLMEDLTEDLTVRALIRFTLRYIYVDVD